jgi:hypothetical protein
MITKKGGGAARAGIRQYPSHTRKVNMINLKEYPLLIQRAAVLLYRLGR